MNDKCQQLHQQLKQAYNPEYDTNPYGPRVTWVEMRLAETVAMLEKRVNELEAKLQTQEAAQ
ncbi:MAG: hypothetical protein D6816_16395 [Bacteroidetes bacterium]|nr:MAG: hypothetical protein D6816_16395 [Bacteroidota bacterium]